MHNRLTQVVPGVNARCLQCIVIGKVEIEQHEHSRLGIDPEQRDQAHPDRQCSCCNAADRGNQTAPMAEKGTASRMIMVLRADPVLK